MTFSTVLLVRFADLLHWGVFQWTDYTTGNFSSAALYDIRASKDVETVAEDGFMYACMVQ